MLSLLCRLADRARNHARRWRTDPDFAAGRRGEDLAHRFLRREGFTIVARNYRPRAGGGEIDLIAWEKDQLAFTRSRRVPLASSGPRKVQSIARNSCILYVPPATM
jgi:putative endonuclease